MTPNTDGLHFRRKVVHGWAFRTDLSHEAVNGIRKYIEDGNPDHLHFNYRRLRDRLRSDPEFARHI